MINERTNTIFGDDNYILLKLEYLKLQDSFKKLISTVSHDLTSPLGYLKFSSEILNSQIDNSSDENLKETARVISSSTFKLAEESKQLVETSKSKLPVQESVSSKEVITSSLEACQIELNNINITGDTEAQLSSDFELNLYLLSHLINFLKNQELKLENIQIEEAKKERHIHLSLITNTNFQQSIFENSVSKLKESEIIKPIVDYLGIQITTQERNFEVLVSLKYL